MDLFGNNDTGADFSPCGKYRYKLWRIWDPDKPRAMCIGLNPSTANHEKNDATIRYLIQMLTVLGYGGFYMTNLFAIISSKPEVLLTCADPLGDNDLKLDEVAAICDDVIFCWGNFRQAKDRIEAVKPKFKRAKCFGFNANGTPFHPLAMMPRNGRDPNSPVLLPWQATK